MTSSDAEAIERANRIVHALAGERASAGDEAGAEPLAEADRIAIAYWRGVIADKLSHRGG